MKCNHSLLMMLVVFVPSIFQCCGPLFACDCQDCPLVVGELEERYVPLVLVSEFAELLCR
jgi:hypothetical protein